MRAQILLWLLLLVVSCGGGGRSTDDSSSIRDAAVDVRSDSLERAAAQAMCDSMIASMQVRYDRLCEARREAYAIVDSALRAEYLERNDVACRALSDSLQIILEQRATIEKWPKGTYRCSK